MDQALPMFEDRTKHCQYYKKWSNDISSLSVAMATHNLLLHLPWVQSTTNYLPNGNKELVFDFLALSIGVSKYDKITYFVYLPNKYVDPTRNAHPGCKAALAGAIGDIHREISYLEAGVPTKNLSPSIFRSSARPASSLWSWLWTLRLPPSCTISSLTTPTFPKVPNIKSLSSSVLSF
jgi:hypothetical protein